MAPPAGYAADSDADDEYERSLMTSPTVVTDDDSQTESDPASTENTPTTFGNADADGSSPRTIITEWTTDECANFIKGLGLPQYTSNFLENEIQGDALIALRHDELKEMGVTSVGHRLTILKGVYDTKVKQDIPIEAEHYVPLSADTSQNNKKATQEDISRIIRSIKLRDERILAYEQKLEKMTEEYRRLREELLPVFRMAKERSQPLPSPIHTSDNPDLEYSHDTLNSPIATQQAVNSQSGVNSNGLSRRPSRKGVWVNSTPKNASPTYPHTIPEGKILADHAIDPSAAAMAASSHLTANLSADRGPNASPNPNLPSPTSPNTYLNQPTLSARGGYPREPAPSIAPSSRSNYYGEDLPQFAYGVTDSSHRGAAPTPTPGRMRTGRDIDEPPTPATGGTGSSGSGSSSTPSVEIFKSFRVSMDDPCYKVLPAALKKYNINADWRQYALYIVFGDQERCLGLEEKPLILFKQLDKEGKKPMFMLRRHAAPMEGHTGLAGSGQGIPSSIDTGRSGQIQLPGGVL